MISQKTIDEVKMVEIGNRMKYYQDNFPTHRVAFRLGDMVIASIEPANSKSSPAVIYGKVLDGDRQTVRMQPKRIIGDIHPHLSKYWTHGDDVYITSLEVREIV